MSLHRPVPRGAVLALSAVVSITLLACDAEPPTSPIPITPSYSAAPGNDLIPGQFIVTLRGGADAQSVAREYGVQPKFVYSHALNGFAGSIADAARAGLLRDSRVLRVEQDREMRAFDTQTGATWGLDRIDQRALPLSGSYSYNTNGAGVHAYIIDTGIRFTHDEFGGRAKTGFDAVTSGGSAADCNGHGSHVAATVGGSTYGVAKGVALVAVRVLNCQGSGTTSGVIAGIDWVTANAVKPAVANMSLGGGASTTLDNAVVRSIAAGISYAIAAGNGDFLGRQMDACTQSPARVADAMTIGATDKTDKKASWSNYGTCIDWFAPGVGITSAWHTSNTATNTISGTSMATPHVAGVAALYLAANASATPQQVRAALYNATTKSIVTSSFTSNNHLLYSIVTGSAPVNAPPTASFTYVCSGLSCNFTDGSSDSDGTIQSRSWNFGDGGTSTQTNPSHTYSAGGNYTVALQVTDNAGATSSTTRSVSVTAPAVPPPPTGIVLSATGYRIKGVQHADLSWSGTAAAVNVYRDGGVIKTAVSAQTLTDNIGSKGGGTYIYKVCETSNPGVCSNEKTVAF